MGLRLRCGIDGFRLTLALIPCGLFLPEILGFSQFAGWDITRLNLPLKWFDVQSLRDGALPLWNHYLYAGMPQLAESESGLFYPGNILLHLPGDFFYWANLTIIGHLILAGLFCDLWLRGRGASRIASFSGAVLFQTAPFLLFHISSMALLQAVVWFPLLLWLADRIIEEPDPRRARFLMGWMAVLGGLLTVVGSAQMAFYEGFLLFWYLVGHVVSQGESRRHSLKRAIAALISLGLGALLLGAVIWIPAREFAQGTVREIVGKGFYWLGTWLTLPRLASAFYFPAYGKQTEIVGWASSLIYVGLLPTILALLRLTGVRVNWRKDAPLIVMGAVALFLAFGMHNPVNHSLIAFSPFSLFRYQGRLAVGVLLALIGLAVQVLSRVRNEADEGGPMDLRIALLWSLGIVLVVLVAFLVTAVRSKAILWGGVVLVVDTLITWRAIVAIQKHSGHRFPPWLAVYLVFHLALVYPVGRLATMYVRDFEEAMSFFEHLERSDGLPPRIMVVDVGRLADRDLLSFNLLTPQHHLPNLCAGNTPVFAGVQTLDPYTPLRPIAWHRIVRQEIGSVFRDAPDTGVLDQRTAALMQLLGIDAVVTSGEVKEIPGYTLLSADLGASFGPDARIHLTETTQPRAWAGFDTSCKCTLMIEDPSRFADAVLTDTLSKLDGPDIVYLPGNEIRRYATDLGPYLFAPNPSIEETNVTSLTLRPNWVGLSVTTRLDPRDREGPSWCVVEVSQDPGWRITLDGEEAETLIANGVFYGVKIAQPGNHTIEFRYEPRSVSVGLLVSLAGFLLVAAWVAANWPRKRRPSPLS